MCNAGLFDAEMLHSRRQRLLVFVAVGLHVIDKLKIDPRVYPVPVEIVDNNVLLHDAAVIAAPCEKSHILAAPLLKLLESVGKAVPEGKTLLIKSGELFHLIVHALKVNGFNVDSKLLGRLHVLRELNCADLNNFAPELYRELVEYGGF